MDWGPYGEAHTQPFSATDVSTGERAPTCPVEEKTLSKDQKVKYWVSEETGWLDQRHGVELKMKLDDKWTGE